ncbi:MAG TPA: potassium channel family protein [Mycobacteriales bacterium]
MSNRHRDRYELVFLLLVSTFVLSAFGLHEWGRLPVLLLYAAALVLALRSSRVPGPISRGVRVVLAVGTIGIGIGVLAAPGDLTEGILSCWIAVVLATTIVIVVMRIVHHRVVTGQTIFGALSAYLMIGFFFSAVFTAIDRLGSGSFFAGGKEANSATIQYFSFVTLSTTGYGDYTAAGDAGRSMAVLEALLGQIFLVTLVARLVALFGTERPERRRERSGRRLPVEAPAGDGPDGPDAP